MEKLSENISSTVSCDNSKYIKRSYPLEGYKKSREKRQVRDMEPRRRKAHKNAALVNALRLARKIPVEKVTVATQTEQLFPEDPMWGKKLVRPKEPRQQQEQPLGDNKPVMASSMGTLRHKACQTMRKMNKRIAVESPLETVQTSQVKRRKLSIAVDRLRLKKLLDEINCDPPPSWETASLMWLDVDVLERRIADFEQEEAASKRPKTLRELSFM